MAWTASVLKKDFDAGAVLVTVEYRDGARTLTETYKAYLPSPDWIPATVRDKIKQLEAQSTFSIALGTVEPALPNPVKDPDELLFARRIRQLEIIKVMIDLGIVKPDDAKVATLTSWIKNNFNLYFDTLDRV